tara:strand:- start:1317 stop:1643 length:327 start_codon:yes stop_codon:yes gene_type:complete
MADDNMDAKNDDDEPCERELMRSQAKARRKEMREKANGFDTMLLRMEKAISKVNESEGLVNEMLHTMESYLQAIRNNEPSHKTESILNQFGNMIDDAHEFLADRGWKA